MGHARDARSEGADGASMDANTGGVDVNKSFPAVPEHRDPRHVRAVTGQGPAEADGGAAYQEGGLYAEQLIAAGSWCGRDPSARGGCRDGWRRSEATAVTPQVPARRSRCA